MTNEDLLLRQAPHSVEAEQAVLGSMLIDADCVKDVMAKLRADDFYLIQNREIFETFREMSEHGKPTDIVTVAGEMRSRGVYDENTTGRYLAQLMEITPTSANVMEYAGIVADKALLRTTAAVAQDILAMAQDVSAKGQDVLEAAEQKIYGIRRNQNTTTMVRFKDVLPEVLDDIYALAESGGKIPGLSTGFSAIDKKINGLNKSDLILLAARPGMGKTALALNIALNAARNGQTVAIFSLEMSGKQLVTRCLSTESLVDNKMLKTGTLTEKQWEQIADATVVLSRQDILLDDNPMMTVADINAKCRRIQNLGLVIVDYLQLMQSSGGNRRNENRQQVVSDMSRMLKLMAKELDVPVLCLSQLNRECESRDNKRPRLSDLRESGAIEQDADIVMFLYRDGFYYPETENPNIVDCIIAKNRHGETDEIELYWTPEYTMFSPLEGRDEQ